MQCGVVQSLSPGRLACYHRPVPHASLQMQCPREATMIRKRFTLCFLVAASLVPAIVGAADESSFTRTEDVVYGRKFGTALTLDVFAPRENANGLGVVFVVSGGWRSAHEQ